MDEVVVCLGCGRIVGAGEGWGCTCPPPSIVPKSSSRDPYRSAPESPPCPRCKGRLIDTSFHDVSALDCTHCQGIFLDKTTIDRLGTEEGRDIRMAFPKRARVQDDGPVRYIECPHCRRLMNRTVFARMSGVIVDVCKDHGVWFDAGEINAVVEFVEKGGLERARQHQRDAHDQETQKLREQWRNEHATSNPTVSFRHSWSHRRDDDLLVRSFFELFVP